MTPAPRTRPRRARRLLRAGLVPLLALLLAAPACSDQAEAGSGPPTTEADDGVALFDPTVVHEVAVDYDEADYDALIAAYADSGDKTWIEATVTIDGVTYERAGLRLKGNSSLMGLAGGRGGPSGADAESPEELPWLIRLDENVDGQRHQGYADLVIRSNRTTTSLNEAVALDLLDAAGLASQQAISTSFTVNGGDPVLRLAVEHPDDDAWQDGAFADAGALYKAESTGDWSYRGDDPDAYTDVFDQEGGKEVADLTPLIDLLRFIDESDDETFAAELPERLDVEAFATYLAMMDLVENDDDIDGPGNNAYLWWDEETGRTTIVPWDMNLAFGGFGGTPRGGTPAGGPPDGGTPPEGTPEGGGGRRGPGGPSARSNVLVTRFHATPELEELYQSRLAELRAELFGGGTAESLLDARVTTLESVPDLVDAGALEGEADDLRERIEATAGG